MWTSKTDRTTLTPRLFWVFACHMGHFVGFGLLRLKCFFYYKHSRKHGFDSSEIRRGSEKRKVDTDRIIGGNSVLFV